MAGTMAMLIMLAMMSISVLLAEAQIKTDDTAQCNAQLLNSTDFSGNDLKRGKAITAAGCCAECFATPGCHAFSVWLDSPKPSGAQCYLKRNAAGRRSSPDHVSATILNPLPPAPPPPPPPPAEPPSGAWTCRRRPSQG